MTYEEGDDPIIQACRNRLPEPTRVEYNKVCTFYTEAPLAWEKDEVGLFIPSPKDTWNNRVTFRRAKLQNTGVCFFAWICELDNKIYY